MSNFWTQALPETTGYYWFSMDYEDHPLCLYFDIYSDYVETYGYFHNGPLTCYESNGYYYSAYPVEPLGWEAAQ